ncbi:MAG: radical SAM protein [Gemmatimonadota bacterium]|jgi:wyosine [tRNA(Phe)-imidazoG37] synthetase (radical SAM superfamily)
MEHSVVFGPVPSRRLGRSLGINHVPPKTCTYSCAYCQLGRTTRMLSAPQRFYGAGVVAGAVRRRVREARAAGEFVDFLTFVPDGEPTLDRELGDTIRLLRLLGIPIALVTNGSLLGRRDVRFELAEVDHVSVKLDSVREGTWRWMNRPHGHLVLAEILEGIGRFAADFSGALTTETMLLDGVNDDPAGVRATAAFIGALRPAAAYLSAPTRPPAEPWARPPTEHALARAYEVFAEYVPRVELLTGYEGDAFASTGDARSDLLSITAVHPMRESAVRTLLDRGGEGWNVVADLLEEGLLAEVAYGGARHYLRPLGECGAEATLDQVS